MCNNKTKYCTFMFILHMYLSFKMIISILNIYFSSLVLLYLFRLWSVIPSHPIDTVRFSTRVDYSDYAVLYRFLLYKNPSNMYWFVCCTTMVKFVSSIPDQIHIKYYNKIAIFPVSPLHKIKQYWWKGTKACLFGVEINFLRRETQCCCGELLPWSSTP